MAEICKRCHADCTEDIAIASLPQKFACKCGSTEFRFVPDTPAVPYTLTPQDRKFLRKLTIRSEP